MSAQKVKLCLGEGLYRMEVGEALVENLPDGFRTVHMKISEELAAKLGLGTEFTGTLPPFTWKEY